MASVTAPGPFPHAPSQPDELFTDRAAPGARCERHRKAYGRRAGDSGQGEPSGMNSRDSASPLEPSAATRAEAAAWIARLHGPNRNARVEEGCRRWMAEDTERATAF